MSSEEVNLPNRSASSAIQLQRGPFLSVELLNGPGPRMILSRLPGVGAAFGFVEETSCAERPLKQRYSNNLKLDAFV